MGSISIWSKGSANWLRLLIKRGSSSQAIQVSWKASGTWPLLSTYHMFAGGLDIDRCAHFYFTYHLCSCWFCLPFKNPRYQMNIPHLISTVVPTFEVKNLLLVYLCAKWNFSLTITRLFQHPYISRTEEQTLDACWVHLWPACSGSKSNRKYKIPYDSIVYRGNLY